MDNIFHSVGWRIWKDENGHMGGTRITDERSKIIVLPTGKTSTTGDLNTITYVQVITPQGLGWLREDFLESV